ncbi:MAG: YitT family protein [Peptostreptococcaceae bacterium]
MWIKKYAKSIALIILGSCILAFGSFNFNYQNNVTEGGVLGLLLLIKNIFDISPSITAIVIDLSLFALGAKYFGKQFLYLSIFASLSFSTWYKIWENIGFIIPNLSNNMLLASILAGIGVGIGIGIIVRAGAAAGGDDAIALIGAKLTHLKVNHVYMITDLIVLVLSLSYLSLKEILFSLIAVTISGKIISLMYNDSEDADEEDIEEELVPVK